MRKIPEKQKSMYMRKFIITVTRSSGSDISTFDKVLKDLTGEKDVASAIMYGARYIEGVNINSIFNLFTRFGEELMELMNLYQQLRINKRKIKKYNKKDKDVPKKLEKETDKLDAFYKKAIKRLGKFAGLNIGSKFKDQYSRINSIVKGKGYEYGGLMDYMDYDDYDYDYDDYEESASRCGVDLSFESLMSGGNNLRGKTSRKKFDRGLMPGYDLEDDDDDSEDDDDSDESRVDHLENMVCKITEVVSNLSQAQETILENQAANVAYEPVYTSDPSAGIREEELGDLYNAISSMSSQISSLSQCLNHVVDKVNSLDDDTVIVSSSEEVVIDEDDNDEEVDENIRLHPANGSLTPRK